jgi:DNA topoisomerase-2
LSGYIAEHSAYHHGEASLHSTIIGLAQDFVGSNNINLLEPIGQFGKRNDVSCCRHLKIAMMMTIMRDCDNNNSNNNNYNNIII